jgi:DNA polymerase III epsilon subunit-like protein
MMVKKSFRESTILVVDTETTGLDPSRHAVVEIGLAMLYPDDRIEVRSYGWRVPDWAQVDPDVAKMPTFLAIQTEAWADNCTFAEAAHRMVWFVKQNWRDAPDLIAAYNAPFDREFLRWNRLRHDTCSWVPYSFGTGDAEWLDVLPWARHDGTDAPSNRLEVACARRGIELPGAHRAGDDAKATAQLLAQLRKATFANGPEKMSDDVAELHAQTRILFLEQELRRLVPQWSYPKDATVVDLTTERSAPDSLLAK